VSAAAVRQHQRADVDGRRAVEDRLADGEDGVEPLLAVDDVGADAALREQRVDHEAVAGVDRALAAQVDHDEVAADGRDPVQLLDEALGLLGVELDALATSGSDRISSTDERVHDLVDERHHELVVRDAEVAEAAEARAAVHEEVEQRPALRAQHVVDVVRGRVGLVDGAHELGGDVGEALGAAEVVVDDAGGRRARRRR
jgi:hypothetical protein